MGKGWTEGEKEGEKKGRTKDEGEEGSRSRIMRAGLVREEKGRRSEREEGYQRR